MSMLRWSNANIILFLRLKIQSISFKKKREENTVDEFVDPDLRVGCGPPIPLDVLVLAHERDNCLDAT